MIRRALDRRTFITTAVASAALAGSVRRVRAEKRYDPGASDT